jgi:hypothetical protein
MTSPGDGARFHAGLAEPGPTVGAKVVGVRRRGCTRSPGRHRFAGRSAGSRRGGLGQFLALSGVTSRCRRPRTRLVALRQGSSSVPVARTGTGLLHELGDLPRAGRRRVTSTTTWCGADEAGQPHDLVALHGQGPLARPIMGAMPPTSPPRSQRRAVTASPLPRHGQDRPLTVWRSKKAWAVSLPLTTAPRGSCPESASGLCSGPLGTTPARSELPA